MAARFADPRRDYYGSSPVHIPTRVLLLVCALSITEPLLAQLPFYTDDPAVTEKGKWHFDTPRLTGAARV